MNIKDLYFPENERPLDRIVTDGGFTGIFRTIACVGDSLSSGEFETVDEAGGHHYADRFEYSWGQFMARMAGCTVYNFSAGGMMASTYCDSFAWAIDAWNPAKAAQAYVIALGINDLMNAGQPLGEMSDICLSDPTQNTKTFTGYYAHIIQRYKAISPNAKFFLVTMPDYMNRNHTALFDAHQARLYELARLFDNTYVLDLRKYGPDYTDPDFIQKFFLSGHLNACGYRLTADLIVSYIDYIIRHNLEDFAMIGVPHE